MEDARARLQEAGRIVVKVGTSTLAYGPGRLNLLRIEKLVRELAQTGRRLVQRRGAELLADRFRRFADLLGRLPNRPKIAERAADDGRENHYGTDQNQNTLFHVQFLL